ncbi:alpha-L-fucosidase [Olivibacter domesticus]|uniref:alpha-L-fucosidase n=1 Tax=Olivibacter domesticus TaxID=407022 RepID=A0A1H7QG98_OLID1|nr:alpha-L-fucosidase [Olivibacter domesticus]SEL46545.1 Alpha-L-fucosidase [Olivibacter domesticus]
MKKRKYIILLLLLSFSWILNTGLYAQDVGDEGAKMYNDPKERDLVAIREAKDGWWTTSMQSHDQRIVWWREAKFGMFIHWGVYSLAGGEWKGKEVGGYAEHLMRKEKISREDYLKLAAQFNPSKFDAEEWVLAAKKAGMNYFIITAKHHDGFAMYDTDFSAFNIIKQTPFKRDPMKELADACRKHDMKFGFYYSHAFDWEHPDAPGNDWEYDNPGGDKLIGGANWYDDHPEWLPKAVKYVNEKSIPQIQELLKKYHPDILWFDTPHKLPFSENLRILKAIRAVDANVVVNGRLARSAQGNFGDYQNTADRPAEFFPVKGDWEAIPTTNESYGYSKYDHSHKPASFFIQLLAKAASKGGNLLMNIGPMGDGAFDPKDTKILDSIGLWMDKNKESIFDTKPTPLSLQSWGVSTQHANKLYLHVFEWPRDGRLIVGGLKNAIRKVYLLNDSQQKSLRNERITQEDVRIETPLDGQDPVNTVVVIEMEDTVVLADSVRLLSSTNINRLLSFDATLIGDGFKYGDGKSNRYYVEGWKSTQQEIQWRVRVLKPTKFKISIKYVAEGVGNNYAFKINDKVIKALTKENPPNKPFVLEELGEVALDEESTEIILRADDIKGDELMKLFEIQLIPITP